MSKKQTQTATSRASHCYPIDPGDWESPKDIEALVEAMARGLRIIATWASCDSGSRETRIEAMEAIKKRAMESLGLTKENHSEEN